MNVEREALLKALDMVQPGLASKEAVEQSSCFVFRGECLYTFNEEICCRTTSPLSGVTAAVPSGPLLDLLRKLNEPTLVVEFTGDELRINGNKRRAGVRAEAAITLPVDSVEQPTDWEPITPEWVDAVAVVRSCASRNTDQTGFALSCVNITPDWVEATDNYQIARYPVPSPVQGACLVRADSLKHLQGVGVTHVCETTSWLHFRTAGDLVLSVRKWVDQYPDNGQFLEPTGNPATLPAGLSEAVDKAQVFTSEAENDAQVIIRLKGGKLLVRGQGPSGWYEEQKLLAYQGPPLSFMISPKLLAEITAKSPDCTIGPNVLYVQSGKLLYATCLEAASA